MRTVYRVLAYLIAAEVVVQAAAMAFGVAGLTHWVKAGGVFTLSAFDESDAFPEVVGFLVHGINGGIVVPALALLLVVCSVFAKVPRGIWWASAVFLLVAAQVMLGYSAADVPSLGALHGVNALLLFGTALVAGRRARMPAPAPESAEQVAARV